MTHRLLNILALILFAALMLSIGFSIITSGQYKQSNEKVLQQSLEPEILVNYVQLNQMLEEGISTAVFIDLRDNQQFRAGHIEGSVNIPLADILHRKNRKLIKSKGTKVLISDNEAGAHAIRMVLLGKGYKNIRVLAGTYQMAEKHVLETFNPSYGFFSEEKAAWDYPRFMPSEASGSAAKQEREAGVPVKQIKVVSAQGGC